MSRFVKKEPVSSKGRAESGPKQYLRFSHTTPVYYTKDAVFVCKHFNIRIKVRPNGK